MTAKANCSITAHSDEGGRVLVEVFLGDGEDKDEIEFPVSFDIIPIPGGKEGAPTGWETIFRLTLADAVVLRDALSLFISIETARRK